MQVKCDVLTGLPKANFSEPQVYLMPSPATDLSTDGNRNYTMYLQYGM